MQFFNQRHEHLYMCLVVGIEEKQERHSCLQLAESEGLDIPQITKMVVENIRSYSAIDFSREMGSKIDTSITDVRLC